jgi:archaeosortase A (PGF-CTERM-specific)
LEIMLNKAVFSLILMMIGWLVDNVLWLSLGFLAASYLVDQRLLSGIGWMLFGIHWLKQPGSYLEIGDYFNVALTFVVAVFCFYMAWLLLVKKCRFASCRWVSFAVAVGGLVYFPFAQFSLLGDWLIGRTAYLTTSLLGTLGVPAILTGAGANTISLNGHSVEIILACTAIESMALFAGVILSVKAPLRRKLIALMISVPVIYVLNLFRNVFVVLAYGDQWFGPESFYLAHNVIAKAGSTVALFLIAYGVLMLLPELLEAIEDLAKVIRRFGGDSP